MDARAPAGAGAGFASLPYGIIQLIVQSLQEPKDQGRAACVSRACRAAVEELAPALFHFTRRDKPTKVLELLRKPYVRSALDVVHSPAKITPLHAAVIYGCTEILSALLVAGASIDVLSAAGDSPMAFSARSGHLHTLQRLLAGGATVDYLDSSQQTSLMVASSLGRVREMDALIAAGSNVNLADGLFGKTALMYACGSGQVAAMRRLHQAGAHIDAAANDGATTLVAVSRQGSVDLAHQLLEMGADIDVADCNGCTALFAAASGGHIRMLERLLIGGADINTTNNEGLSALGIAGKCNHMLALESLLANGASVAGRGGYRALVAAYDKDDRTLITALRGAGATVCMEDVEGWPVLIPAAATGDLSEVEKLLAAGADVDAAAHSSKTALMFAAELGHAGVVRRLLEGEPDVNLSSMRDMSALEYAAYNNHVGIVDSLIAAGGRASRGAIHNMIKQGKHAIESFDRLLLAGAADGSGGFMLLWASQYGRLETVIALIAGGVAVDYAVPDGDGSEFHFTDGSTALMLASAHNRPAVVDYLLREGAATDLENEDGRTAMEFAANNSHLEIIEKLLAAGGKVGKWVIYGMVHSELHATLIFDRLLVAGAPSGGGHMLLWASQYGRLEAVKGLLSLGVDADALPEDDDDDGYSIFSEEEFMGTTALMLAARHSHVDVVDVLLAKGAAVHRQDAEGSTALDLAVETQNPELLQKLLAAVAVNSAECGGLLVSACRAGSLKLVEALLAAGVTVHAKEDEGEDDEGMTALMLAAEGGYLDVVSLLLEAGAAVLAKDTRKKTAIAYAKENGHEEVVGRLKASAAVVIAADKVKAQAAVEEAARLAARLCAYTGCSAPESAIEAQPRMLCFGCRALRYCSTGCQTADWPAHKLACRELAKRKQSSGA